MELPYDCPLHVCKANGFMAENGEATKLLIPATNNKMNYIQILIQRCKPVKEPRSM